MDNGQVKPEVSQHVEPEMAFLMDWTPVILIVASRIRRFQRPDRPWKSYMSSWGS